MLSKEKMLLDGSMGAMLIAAGAGADSAGANINYPDIVCSIQRGYAESGSMLLASNTFGVTVQQKHDLPTLIISALDIARRAAKGHDTLVAYDCGPCGLSYDPLGDDTYEQAHDFYRDTIKIAAGRCDCILFETFTNLRELKTAISAAREVCDLPILASMSFNAGGHTYWGDSIAKFADAMNELLPFAAGLNCALTPDDMLPLVLALKERLTPEIAVLAQANRGSALLVDGVTTYEMSAAEFADGMLAIYRAGVPIIGGCCGSDRECIRLMAEGMAE